jgi:hypothetical protein
VAVAAQLRANAAAAGCAAPRLADALCPPVRRTMRSEFSAPLSQETLAFSVQVP